jgi:hypothetical protein
LGPVEQALKGLLVGQQEKQVAPLCGAASLIPTWKGQTGITKTVGNGLPAHKPCSYSINLQERKQLRNSHDNMFSTELTTYKAGGALSDKSMHPSKYGRVSAWVKKTRNDPALVKEDMYGHPPPSIAFERPAEKFMGVATTDPPVGYAPPGDQQSHIVQQPRNQPTPRRTKFGDDGTFLAGVGVVLGVLLGVVLKTENALRPPPSVGVCAGPAKSEEPRAFREVGSVDSGVAICYIHNTDTEEQAVVGL